MKKQLSLLVVILLLVLMVCGRIWKPNPRPISWDVAGYYLYLPANFIYHDPGLKNFEKFDSLRIRYETSSSFYQVYPTPKNYRIIKYTMGNSVLYSPFFFIGHLVARIGNFPADGYSQPYQVSLLLGSFLYAFIAILLARKILLYFFNDKVTAVTLFAIVMGTNLFLMESMDNLQTHCQLFFLYTLLTWRTIKYHEQPGYLNAVLMGVCAGLIILVRPTDIVSWAIPALWGINSLKDIITKLKTHFKFFLVFFLVASVLFFPQMLYWKMFAGSWLFNSYDNPGEGLDLLGPHTIKFLFSYRKGWLIYTPLMIFALIGILLTIRNKKKIFLALSVFFILNLWIVSSWTCWWYAGSFSSRAMIQSYAVLMIPLGFFIQYLHSQKTFISATGKLVVGLLVCLCMFQTWQYAQGILKYDGMTKAFYWRTFGSISRDPSNDKYLLKNKSLDTDTIPNIQNFKQAKEYVFNFNDQYGLDVEAGSRFVQVEGETDYSVFLDSAHVFYTIMEDEYYKMTNKYYAYVRVEGNIFNTRSYVENPVVLVRHMMHKGKTYGYNLNTLFDGDTSSGKQWREFKIDYIFPDVRKPEDGFKTYFWLMGTSPVYVKDLHVFILEAKEFPELQ